MLHYRCCLRLFILAIGLALISTPTFGASERTRPSAPKRLTAKTLTPPLPTPVPAPFAAGERLTFTAFFNALPAGDGEIQLRREQQTNGKEAFRFTGQARTNEWIDVLYKRRDTAEAVFGLRDYFPSFFRLLSREGKRRREYAVRYDPTTKTLLGRATKRKQVREQSLAATNLYDPVSALYLLRSRKLVPGTPIQIDLFTGKGRYRFVAHVTAPEIVKVDNREHHALRLHPQIFSLDKNLSENILPEKTTLWVSTDELHTPLKLESATVWGWIAIELKKHSVTSREKAHATVSE